MTGDRSEPGARLLVVEDDSRVGMGLVVGLRKAGFDVEVATDVPAAQAALRGEPPALVVLDLMLPSGSGVELLARLAERGGPPVIVLTARTDLHVRLQCFDLGAVDFLAKPFFMEELVARARARLNLAPPERRQVVRWGETEAQIEARSVVRGGAPVGLTRTETDVLFYLLRRPGAAVTRELLAERVLAGEADAGPRTVDSHVARIRKKLQEDGAAIRTVWGIGYRFAPEPRS